MRSIVVALLLASGCYHYSFEQRRAQPGEQLVTFTKRAPTYVNGLVGTGTLDARRYCADPVRTELEVRATDVLISIATLLIYTPHTLRVTCGTADRTTATLRR